MSQQQALAALRSSIGKEIHASEWVDVTPERVQAFAEATGDHQWIHVDHERATKESPYGGPIAHGYLTLSLYPMLRGLVEEATPVFPGVKQVINYGINKLRFPNAVRVGSRVRARCSLVEVEEIKGGLQLVENCAIEVENEAKPACVAELIMRLYF